MSSLEIRKLSVREVEICERNLAGLGLKIRFCRKKCGNPYCGYPLAPLVEHNHVVDFGEVCDLCHAMFSSVRVRPGLAAAHDQWKKEQDQKKKILDQDKYFNK